MIKRQNAHPILVGNARPAACRIVRRLFVFGDFIVSVFFQSAVGVSDQSFQNRPALRRRNVRAPHQSVVEQRKRAVGIVFNTVGHREHIVFVHGNLTNEFQSRLIVPRQSNGLFGRQFFVRRRPNRLRIRQSQSEFVRNPAEFRKERKRRSDGRKQRDMRTVLFQSFTVFQQRQIVETRAFQPQRSLDRRRFDRQVGVFVNRLSNRYGRGRFDCRRRGNGRGGNNFGRFGGLRRFRLRENGVHREKQNRGEYYRQNQIAFFHIVLLFHYTHLFCSDYGTGSSPLPPHGLQRKTRFKVNQDPFIAPYFSNASSA